MLKIRGKIWIEKQGYEWVRVEAETTGTISFGWFLARLAPGAKLVFEQTRVNDEVWLPKREFLSGHGRIGLLKRVAEDDEITWRNYRKFRVDSKVMPRRAVRHAGLAFLTHAWRQPRLAPRVRQTLPPLPQFSLNAEEFFDIMSADFVTGLLASEAGLLKGVGVTCVEFFLCSCAASSLDLRRATAAPSPAPSPIRLAR